VANTIGYRRRKGTLGLLRRLASDVAGWPARVVEFAPLIARAQHMNHLGAQPRGTVDVRGLADIERLDGPFDPLAHTVDVRRIGAIPPRGRYNLPSIGAFVWRLRPYSVTLTPAYCVEEAGAHCYTFSVLGNRAPLFSAGRPADPEADPGPADLPAPISRHAFARDPGAYYGEGKSLAVYRDDQLVPLEQIVAADLSSWGYAARRGKLAIDPEEGRMAFPLSQLPRRVRVRYYYGFSDELGGGEYERRLREEEGAVFIPVRGLEELQRALEAYRPDSASQRYNNQPARVVIEIGDSGVYSLPFRLRLRAGNSLQLRAAVGARPVIRLIDWSPDAPDPLFVEVEPGGRMTLDGLLISGRAVLVRGVLPEDPTDSGRLAADRPHKTADDCATSLSLRHCTLVPGWNLDQHCRPKRPSETSLELDHFAGRVLIERCIIGSIQVRADAVGTDPLPISILDSIVDAAEPNGEAIGGAGMPVAHALLTVRRCTIFGIVDVHAIELAENSIFMDCLNVARRQLGCMRFCYVPAGCRTPRRYNCQPDLAMTAVSAEDRPAAAERVRPRFNSVRYGQPAYAQLAETCAPEIRSGADDESEMGVFHDLFQAQREANLRARLLEYSPAAADIGIIFVS
jgi:hypothetical protein